MPTEILAGRSANVLRMGAGGPAVLGIHCSLARSEALLPLIKTLAPSGRVTLFDMPGHGRSAPWDDEGDYQGVTAQQALELCTNPTHIIGHSFGATVALRAAVLAPELVSRLTLIEPVFFAAAKGTQAYEQHRRDFLPFEEAIAIGDTAKAAEVFNDMWGALSWSHSPAATRSALIDQIHLIPAGAPAIEEDNAELLTSGALEALDLPVTLIRGDKTQPIIADIHHALVRRLPNATDLIVKGAGHMLPITHPSETATLIKSS
ncbi:Pimeloyl-ACP methyl ester carboxylesterase [Cognatiyoonia sediminum]|uniref:Pimeloyl-ACP methyl ester carboxylesterase n=1 Tax=Cognatiyoonia sediminum TaxID=1508389 RepID=A0A1M5NST0_9RHOB|nr:alpha/beta hydrolase [Cognatiyoonia sediminum]SHG92592.1 Pimeloyl-ACP methyl ester carboxylesterase [Cognatiyoonia sediminum]